VRELGMRRGGGGINLEVAGEGFYVNGGGSVVEDGFAVNLAMNSIELKLKVNEDITKYLGIVQLTLSISLQRDQTESNTSSGRKSSSFRFEPLNFFKLNTRTFIRHTNPNPSQLPLPKSPSQKTIFIPLPSPSQLLNPRIEL